MLLTSLQFTQIPIGYTGTIFFTLQNIVNDPLVKTVDPKIRRCVFPDENSNSNYPYYSYSVCVTECLKMAQIKMCNCCHHNMIIDGEVRFALNQLAYPSSFQKTTIAPFVATKAFSVWTRGM